MIFHKKKNKNKKSGHCTKFCQILSSHDFLIICLWRHTDSHNSSLWLTGESNVEQNPLLRTTKISTTPVNIQLYQYAIHARNRNDETEQNKSLSSLHYLYSFLSFCLTKVKTQYLHFRFHAKYFLLPRKILEEISRQSILFQLKGSIYHIKHNVHTSFYHSSGLTRNLMYLLCFIFVDTAFLLGTAELTQLHS